MIAQHKYHFPVAKDPLLISSAVINLFFIANVFFIGWSFTWPEVNAIVIATDIIEHGICNDARGLRAGQISYALLLKYKYYSDSIWHINTGLIDTFVSRQLCSQMAAQYQNKTINVHVNPLNKDVSTINPGQDFSNALMCAILVLILTIAILYILWGKKQGSSINNKSSPDFASDPVSKVDF